MKDRKKHETAVARQEMVDRVNKLESARHFTEEVSLPTDLAAALITMRPELLKAVRPRALTEEEAKAIYNTLAVLIETNTALREHAQELSRMTKNMMGGFTTISRVADSIVSFGNFEHIYGEDE